MASQSIFLLAFANYILLGAYQLNESQVISQDEKRSLFDLNSILSSFGGNQTDCYDYLTPNTTAEVMDQTIPKFDPYLTTFEDSTIYAFQFVNHYLAWNKSKLLKIENIWFPNSPINFLISLKYFLHSLKILGLSLERIMLWIFNTFLWSQIKLATPIFLKKFLLEMRKVNIYWSSSSGEYALM